MRERAYAYQNELQDDESVHCISLVTSSNNSSDELLLPEDIPPSYQPDKNSLTLLQRLGYALIKSSSNVQRNEGVERFVFIL